VSLQAANPACAIGPLSSGWFVISIDRVRNVYGPPLTCTPEHELTTPRLGFAPLLFVSAVIPGTNLVRCGSDLNHPIRMDHARWIGESGSGRALGGLVALTLLAFAAISGRIAGTPITAAMVFTAVGLIFGSEALGLIDVPPAGETVKLLAEATLALVLFADASRIDVRALRGELSVPLRLLGIGLPLTILAGFVLALVVFPQLLWSEALLLAVILAPTDAALGQAVVTLMRLPSRVRQGLNVESGLNDGICVPLFWIVLAIAQAESGAIGDGAAVRLVLEQIGYGILAGVVAGIAAACVVVVAGQHQHVGGSWLQVVPLAGAGLAFGIADPIGGSGFIAPFVGGFVFGAIRRRSGGEVGHLIEELGEIFNAVTFIVFGAVLLGPVLGDVTWSIALYAVLSLTVVRLIPVAIAMIGTGARRQTLAFLGWFGPRGLASIVFAVLVLEEGGLPHDGLILTTTYVTIGLSVLAHGLTAAPLANRYASWYESHPREALGGLEGSDVREVRWRFGVGHSRAQASPAAAE
jgi:NhaP-type Na+/H+ or K+/H+ antiporter